MIIGELTHVESLVSRGLRAFGEGFRGIPHELNLHGLGEVIVGELPLVVAQPVPLRERLEVLVTAV